MDSTLDLASESLGFVEALYDRYLRDPHSVSEAWRQAFERLGPAAAEVASSAIDGGIQLGPSFRPSSIFNPPGGAAGGDGNGAAVSAAGVPSSLGVVEVRPPSSSSIEEWVRFLSAVPLFQYADQGVVEDIARAATEITLEDGQLLFRQGEASQDFFVVIEGRVVIVRDDETVANLQSGQVVGELGVLDHAPRIANAIASGTVRALRLTGEDILGRVEEHPALALGLLRGLAGRLRDKGTRQVRVDQLLRSYRVRGHLAADINPLGNADVEVPELGLDFWGLGEEDLDSLFFSRTIPGTHMLTLRQIRQRMEEAYCGSIGLQYMHIDSLERKEWLQRRVEDPKARRQLSPEEQRRILTKLTDAEIFEQFLHKKFLGAKRFSAEGAETLIPLLEQVIEDGAEQGLDEVVIGMAHRGRLNVLANIMEKEPAQIFREFRDDTPELYRGRGDVKYHLGYSSDRTLSNGRQVHLSLCFNPSHLEFVAPVAMGRVRAKQDHFGDTERNRAMAIVIHGDAAFAGQGVVQEMLNMSLLPAYFTGGTLHLIVNNQIGFTTPPESARSVHYATDVAKMLQTPIFHVNGEHPEAVAHTVSMAMEYRRKFHSDVIIDMYCYRLYGHNEGDEPSFTQPVLYEKIRQRKTVREAYIDSLVKLGDIDREEADRVATARREVLEVELQKAGDPSWSPQQVSSGAGAWSSYRGGLDSEVEDIATRFDSEQLARLLREQTEVPEGFQVHRKLQRLLFKARREMADGNRPLDWSAGESLALATLLEEGHSVRLTGQDAGRGTFSHRHAVLHDSENGNTYLPLTRFAREGQRFEVWDSPLSEVGPLGFEYGMSLDSPDWLVLWEAQFGDFVNVAQVIIDQFISSSEDKWRRLSGLVMLLPHGFEGQGPEHSSARLERFLNLCAEDNLQVVNLTTPAQLFHCLRRQVLRPWRKPLIVMSPKSLLRHAQAVSSLEELSDGAFQRLIADQGERDPAKVDRVLLTSGKLYYELADAREQREAENVAILRLEQYYPLRLQELEEVLGIYADGTPVTWVQEEPANMGAGSFLLGLLGDKIAGRWPLRSVSRLASASPATGSAAAHKQEQAELIERAFSS
ncbi:MAG: 2-oxoglutarate dehydrogenase E1 component [Acidobacteriota bacterium]